VRLVTAIVKSGFWILVYYCRASLYPFHVGSSSLESLNSTNPSWRLGEFTIQNTASKSINNESSEFQARYLSCHKILCNWRERWRERERGRAREALISSQEGERKYRPTSDRSHNDVAYMSVFSLVLFIVAVSTARLFEISVNG